MDTITKKLLSDFGERFENALLIPKGRISNVTVEHIGVINTTSKTEIQQKNQQKHLILKAVQNYLILTLVVTRLAQLLAGILHCLLKTCLNCMKLTLLATIGLSLKTSYYGQVSLTQASGTQNMSKLGIHI